MDRQELGRLVSKPTTDICVLFNSIREELGQPKNVTFENLSFYIMQRTERKRYRHFRLPKRSSGFRDIYSPNAFLHSLQLDAKYLLEQFYNAPNCVVGFVNGRSVKDGAQQHVGRRYMMNLDLKDFFSQVSAKRIVKTLMAEPYNFSPRLAIVIARLCCVNLKAEKFSSCIQKKEWLSHLHLPQGTCTSPLLTNIVCETMDRSLSELCAANGVVYTRYADDITLSSDTDIFRNASGQFTPFVKKFLSNLPYRLNKNKTHLSRAGQHREVTGLTVSDKGIGVGRAYIREIRDLLFIWERYGLATAEERFAASYAERHGNTRAIPSLPNFINGKLCYLKMVKGNDAPVYQRLRSQFEQLEGLQLLQDCKTYYIRTDCNCRMVRKGCKPQNIKSSEEFAIQLKKGHHTFIFRTPIQSIAVELDVTDCDSQNTIDVIFESNQVDNVSAVDLGLPSGTLWASKNLGATSASEAGDFYAFGETETKDIYDRNHYAFFSCDDEPTQMPADAATAKLGDKWSTPTVEQFEELESICEIMHVQEDNYNGLQFIAPNGNSIFLPLGGRYVDDRHVNTESDGYYWTKPKGTIDFEKNSNAKVCHIINEEFGDCWVVLKDRYMCQGYNIRPVISKKK